MKFYLSCTFTLTVLMAVLMTASDSPAQRRSGDGDYFQQFVHYTIHAKLDDDKKHLSGTNTIKYTNNSPDTLSEFYLHLYPNAYRNKDTAFMQDVRREVNVTLFGVPKKHRGWLDISNVRVDGTDVVVDVDDTIAHFMLPAPLLPGASIEVDMTFDSKIRQHIGRAGYRGDHYEFAQWYPKVVVYDENGFHPDQFMTGEFYGEFGVFDVHMDTPERYVIAATGEVVTGNAGWDYNSVDGKSSNAPSGDERKLVHFHAEQVHDFAWCADPSYIVESTTWEGIDIHSIYRKGSRSSWQDSTLARGVRAMKWLDEKYGKYPYPQITIADAILKGGMEYPMLVMNWTSEESLIFHELGHQYFFAILANDEREEAWLDEGFTSFQTQQYAIEHYGPWGDRSKWNWYQRMTPQYGIWESYRRKVFALDRVGYSERVIWRSEKYEHSYGLHVYTKAALVLNAVKYAAGNEKFDEIMRTYYEKWQLKHVNTDRFREVVETATATNLERQFEQWLHTTKTVDYALDDVSTEQVSDGVAVSVEIRRTGELTVPITLHFTMNDGEVITKRIEGRLRRIKATFTLPSEPKRTAINPDNEIMDARPIDNHLPRRRAFQFDWPNNNYYPEWAYQYRYRPGVWYNDIDGLKAGLHFRGSYQNWSRRIKLGIYYGVESDRVDFSAQYDFPLKFLGRNSRMYYSGYKMEGRQDFDTHIRITQRDKLINPPTHQVYIGYNYHELTRPEYLTSTEIYDTLQADLGPYFAYSVDPQFDVMSSSFYLRLKLGRGWFGGNYDYQRLSSAITFKTRTSFIPIDLRIRGFAGFIGGEAPKQQKFNLAGGGTLQQNQRFWLRSKGAIWPDANYHEPGHGNVRGYLPGTFAVDQLAAFNVEAGTRLPLLGLSFLFKTFPGFPSWYGFFDVAKVFDAGNAIPSSARIQALFDQGYVDGPIMDAGVGFRSRAPLPFWDLTMRLDFPLWINRPEINGETEASAYRYLFSLSTTF